MSNKCVKGKLDGVEFELSSSTTKINYRDGYYLKSSVRDGELFTLWVWHDNNEKPAHPINPN